MYRDHKPHSMEVVLILLLILFCTKLRQICYYTVIIKIWKIALIGALYLAPKTVSIFFLLVNSLLKIVFTIN